MSVIKPLPSILPPLAACVLAALSGTTFQAAVAVGLTVGVEVGRRGVAVGVGAEVGAAFPAVGLATDTAGVGCGVGEREAMFPLPLLVADENPFVEGCPQATNKTA